MNHGFTVDRASLPKNVTEPMMPVATVAIWLRAWLMTLRRISLIPVIFTRAGTSSTTTGSTM